MLGNFIADSVKGTPFDKFPKPIAEGIQMHREIDSFTDNHQVFVQSKLRLRDGYGKYAPVIVDIFYDYFLAKNWRNYSNQKLKHFASNAYNKLGERRGLFPQRAERFYYYMVKYDILTQYSTLEGIQQVLNGMSRRSKFESNMENATRELVDMEKEFETEFEAFFPDIMAFVEKEYK